VTAIGFYTLSRVTHVMARPLLIGPAACCNLRFDRFCLFCLVDSATRLRSSGAVCTHHALASARIVVTDKARSSGQLHFRLNIAEVVGELGHQRTHTKYERCGGCRAWGTFLKLSSSPKSGCTRRAVSTWCVPALAWRQAWTVQVQDLMCSLFCMQNRLNRQQKDKVTQFRSITGARCVGVLRLQEQQ
jgi:hypothetical protein